MNNNITWTDLLILICLLWWLVLTFRGLLKCVDYVITWNQSRKNKKRKDKFVFECNKLYTKTEIKPSIPDCVYINGNQFFKSLTKYNIDKVLSQVFFDIDADSGKITVFPKVGCMSNEEKIIVRIVLSERYPDLKARF